MDNYDDLGISYRIQRLKELAEENSKLLRKLTDQHTDEPPAFTIADNMLESVTNILLSRLYVQNGQLVVPKTTFTIQAIEGGEE